jgi:hypothetical protein
VPVPLTDQPLVCSKPVSRTTVFFNDEVIVDIFVISGQPVLSVVDRDTHFQSATFLTRGTKAVQVWQALLQCWVCRYVGAPDSIRTDYGSQFVGAEFQTLAAEMNISCSPVPVESAYSMGIGERYHGPVRRIFDRLQIAHPNEDQDLVLNIAVKACNDTMGIDGLVPTLLLDGVYRRKSDIRCGPLVITPDDDDLRAR